MNKEIAIQLFGREWTGALGQEYLDSKAFSSLAFKIAKERETKTVYPSRENVFRCFRETSFDKVSVILLGQDCYHDGSADGLCFSNSLTSKISPSLRNILKEIDTEYPENKEDISHGRLDLQDLSRFAKQGVLMLNSALTVEEHKAGSHLELWQPFTTKVFEVLNTKNELIWILLGKDAQKFTNLITNKTHTILTASHPAVSLYGGTGFFNSNIFRRCNENLIARNKSQIIW